MNRESEPARFKRLMLPHLDAAYTLARWLMKSDADAQDAVQDAMLRAFKAFATWHGDAGRPWLLKIVRNCCYTQLQARKRDGVSFDEAIAEAEPDENPEAILLAKLDREQLRQALDDLPVEFREAIVLRELEGLAYKEITAIAGVPIGTVMSRLARARDRLRELLTATGKEERR